MARLPDYQVSGEGEVTVFLSHGLLGAKDYWKPHTRRLLAKGFRVVAWDHPGYGLSPLPEGLSFDRMAEAGAALIQAVGSRVNIVHGHSMGGQATPRLYGLIPDRIQALVIGSTIGYLGNRTKEEQAQFIRERSGAMASGQQDPAAVITRLVDSLMAPTSSGEEVELVNAVARTTPTATFSAAMKAIQSNKDEDAIAAIQAIGVPTLLIAGSVDQTGKPDGMKRVADMIPRGEFAVIDGVGHYGWAEKPDAYNAVLHPFLERFL